MCSEVRTMGHATIHEKLIDTLQRRVLVWYLYMYMIRGEGRSYGEKMVYMKGSRKGQMKQ